MISDHYEIKNANNQDIALDQTERIDDSLRVLINKEDKDDDTKSLEPLRKKKTEYTNV